MSTKDMQVLCDYARRFAALTDDKIAVLHAVYPDIESQLTAITDTFYDRLQTIDKAKVFLDGRVSALKPIHVQWLNELFTSQFDEAYTRKLYNVGHVHVKVKLPVEFMTGAMTIIQGELLQVLIKHYAGNPEWQVKAIDALNAATGFSSLVMQESYQSSSLAEELERFLVITGMSRLLFDNLARAYKKK